MYRTSQVYSDGSNPNARWSQNHLVKELSKTLDEDCKQKLYVGNLHFQATEYQVVKLFQEHGKIKREQFMYHRGGAKKGEPRGVMYIEYETEDEALAGILTHPALRRALRTLAPHLAGSLTLRWWLPAAAKEKMNGRMLIGRPLLVRQVDEQTNKEELLGQDEDFNQAEEAAASANMVQHQKTIEADACDFQLIFTVLRLFYDCFATDLGLFYAQSGRPGQAQQQN